ncbi:MAG TPA: ROK family protein [Vicinamibacterales bacterium]|nr:ROK family protein [Vicinamibacterales bacterium]
MRLGIDLGGTKIAAIVLDDLGRELWRTRVATPREDYEGTLAQIAALVAEGTKAAGVSCSIGIGIPGAPSRVTGLIKNANSTWLNGRELQKDLEARLGTPVRLANDANCLVASEMADGAAAGAGGVFGVILGTGTGGGLAANGALIEGVNSIAGEWGHNPLPWPDASELPGEACYCGRSGCIETWLSGPGLARDYARAGGEVVLAEEVVTRASRGDMRAAQTLDRWEGRLARALSTVINIVDPEVIVVGGGLSAIERLYDRVPALWGQWIFSDAVTTRLVPARHGADSGVRGAAGLWTVPNSK